MSGMFFVKGILWDLLNEQSKLTTKMYIIISLEKDVCSKS